MPWLSTDPMKERTKLVLEWEERSKRSPDVRVNLSELARKYGVTRQSVHTWINRYLRANGALDALKDKSRRPHSTPTKVSEEIEYLIVVAKKTYPKWGPRKLRYLLAERYPNREWPSVSCMSTILKRHGLTTPRRKRRRSPIAVTAPFSTCDAPNDVWCVDFKGKFRTRDGTWCHVLTLVDAYSRFLLRCELVLEPTGRNVERVMDSAFQEFGLPKAMRSDNGPPFASTGAGGLTSLSVWWLRLGLELQRIQPGKPYQNGRQERVHLTLEEVVGQPAAHPRAQQRALDLWRHEYNEIRPHEALRMKTPAAIYERSRRSYPCELIVPNIYDSNDQHQLDSLGRLRWQCRWIHISSALARETVDLVWENDLTHFDVYFGPILLGTLDSDHPERGLRIARRRRTRGAEPSRMSLD